MSKEKSYSLTSRWSLRQRTLALGNPLHLLRRMPRGVFGGILIHEAPFVGSPVCQMKRLRSKTQTSDGDFASSLIEEYAADKTFLPVRNLLRDLRESSERLYFEKLCLAVLRCWECLPLLTDTGNLITVTEAAQVADIECILKTMFYTQGGRISERISWDRKVSTHTSPMSNRTRYILICGRSRESYWNRDFLVEQTRKVGDWNPATSQGTWKEGPWYPREANGERVVFGDRRPFLSEYLQERYGYDSKHATREQLDQLLEDGAIQLKKTKTGRWELEEKIQENRGTPYSDYWNGDLTGQLIGVDNPGCHAYPVELWCRCLNLAVEAGTPVLNLRATGGTALLAAEKNKHPWVGIEDDPGRYLKTIAHLHVHGVQLDASDSVLRIDPVNKGQLALFRELEKRNPNTYAKPLQYAIVAAMGGTYCYTNRDADIDGVVYAETTKPDGSPVEILTYVKAGKFSPLIALRSIARLDLDTSDVRNLYGELTGDVRVVILFHRPKDGSMKEARHMMRDLEHKYGKLDTGNGEVSRYFVIYAEDVLCKDYPLGGIVLRKPGEMTEEVDPSSLKIAPIVELAMEGRPKETRNANPASTKRGEGAVLQTDVTDIHDLLSND